MKCLSALLTAVLGVSVAADSPAVDWETIVPSRNLVYHHCHHGKFECARLILPLDWLDDKNNHTVIIPIVKLPATVAEHDPTFGGAIVTNPGGPGELGTEFVVDFGYRLRSVADKPGRRHYEIISFDPRGIGNSKPAASCFSGNALDRIISSAESRANGATFQGPGAIPYGLALQEIYGKRCKEADGRLEGGIFEYMGTTSVARDVVELVDRIQEARAREHFRKDGAALAELRRRNVASVNRVQYWGFSYGTVLGNVLASLFPERIGRIVLDGVVDAEDFVFGPSCSLSITDTDKIVDSFMHGCFKAGPSKCSMARKLDTSASDIKARFSKWFDHMKQTPKVVSVQEGTFIITHAEVGRYILSMLYKPIQTFKELASVLQDCISGNYTNLAAKMLEMNILSNPSSGCAAGTKLTQAASRVDGRNGVVCGDGADLSHESPTWWHAYFQQLLQTSSIAAPYWSTIRFTCARWPFQQKWSFQRPFVTPMHDPDMVAGKPAAPILFISNRLDPVTPLAGARKMAKRHPGAGLVIQESLGHCALVTAESECLNRRIADYLETGHVPVPGGEASCDVRCGAWDDGCRVQGLDVKSQRHGILGAWPGGI